VAIDLLQGGDAHASYYTAEERATFEQYINGQLQKIQLPYKDEDYLRTKMLEMYANPALNQLSVVKG
jgi:C-terminal processing protease CtpA/Prc